MIRITLQDSNLVSIDGNTNFQWCQWSLLSTVSDSSVVFFSYHLSFLENMFCILSVLC